MIGKVIGGKSFSGTVGYVMKKDSEILDSEGIIQPEVKDMVRDFEDQAQLNPRVKNKVGHISLSFSEHDKLKLTDSKMTEIAKEYIAKMGIENTQYLIVHHHDAPHPHCHIVYNRVNNEGKTISDSNIRLRNMTACKELTQKHGLYFAPGKENVREHRLREPDKTRYEIYHAIEDCLKTARSWGDLERNLGRRGIGMEFKFKGSTGIKEGVKFSKNGYSFSGSKVDRQLSYSKLDSHFNGLQRAEKKLQTAVGEYRSAFGKCFSSSGGKSGNTEANLSAYGAGSIPLPQSDLGIGLSAAQLQRQPGESPEHHIARITALIQEVTAAMLAHPEEQKRKQKQIKQPKIRR